MDLSDSLGPLTPELAIECSIALSSHERALLYSRNIKNEDPIEHLLQNANGEVATFIAILYTDLQIKLHDRFTKLIEQYIRAKGGILYPLFGLNLPDRDAESVSASMTILSKRIKKLATQSHFQNYKGPTPPNPKILLEYYQPNWRALQAMSHLMMEELTYLGKRIDDINGIRRTLRSFFVAIVGVLLATIGIFFKFWDIPKDIEKIKVTQSLSQETLHNQLDGLNAVLESKTKSAIERLVKTQEESEHQLSEAIKPSPKEHLIIPPSVIIDSPRIEIEPQKAYPSVVEPSAMPSADKPSTVAPSVIEPPPLPSSVRPQ